MLQRLEKNPFMSKAQRIVFRVCTICLSVYISYAVYFSKSTAFTSTGATVISLLLMLLLSAALFVVLTVACDRLAKVANFSNTRSSGKTLPIFAAAFLIAVIPLIISWCACKPGGVNYDVSNQWRQAHSGEYNNWHPLLHTLYLRTLLFISDDYAFLVLCSIVLFSLAAADFTVQVKRSGVPAVLAVLLTFICCCSKPVRNPMMYPGKDAAMTTLSVMLISCTLRILYTKGEWLHSWPKRLLFGLLLTACTLIRHNAAFFTVPLFVCIALCTGTNLKNTLTTILVWLGGILLVTGLLFSKLDIVYPKNTVEESVGIPMTVLGDVMKQNPEAMPDEARDFLLTLADESDWQQIYQLHSYNSIKFTYPRELIAEHSIADIIRMSWQTAATSPKIAFDAVNAVTDLVWGLDGKNLGYTRVSNSGDLPNVVAESGTLQQIGSKALSAIDWFMDLAPIRYPTQNIGVEMLLMLLCALLCIRKCGVSALPLCVPVLIYNFGTMCMLCGNDSRFFQFSMFLSYPLGAVMLMTNNSERVS